MPAKGWRRDEQDMNFETALDNEKVSIDSLLFPRATIHKLSKQLLSQPNSNMILSKDSQTVIQRASVLFVNYVYHHAKQHSKEQGRKVVNANDVLVALDRARFQNFIPTLQEELENFNKRKEQKKKDKPKKDDVEDNDDDNEKEQDDAENASKRTKLDETATQTPANEAEPKDRDVSVGEDEAENEEIEEAIEEHEEEENEENDDAQETLNASQRIQQELKELEGNVADEDTAPDEEEDEEEAGDED